VDTQPVAELPRIGEPDGADFALAVETFKLLADVTRLKILWALLHSEHSVNELAAHVGANAPAVSQQLAKLRATRLVRVRRDGNHRYYAAENPHVQRLVEQALFDHPNVGGERSGRLQPAGAGEAPRKTRGADRDISVARLTGAEKRRDGTL
jgi:DNA-binding transcriptional ArsR family regulator